MNSELLIALIAGLGGMIGWGVADLFAKITIDKIGDVQSLVLAHIFGTVVLLLTLFSKILFLAEKTTLSIGFRELIFVSIFGILQGIVYLLVYKGFGKGQLALLNPIFASFSGLTALLSIFILKEVVSGQLLFGLTVLFIGIILLNIDLDSLKKYKLNFVKVEGFPEIAGATILAAFWTLYWNTFIGEKDWLLYTFLMYTIMTVFLLIYAFIKKIDLSTVKSHPQMWKFLILIGLFETGAYLSISLGYSKTNLTSLVALLSGTFSLPTIVLARILLKEKTTRIQTIGSLVIIIGIAVLSLI